MTTSIKCPHCNKEFEPTDAWRHQLEEELGLSIEEKYKKQVEEAKAEAIKEVSEKIGKDLESEKERNKKLSDQLNELLEETRKLRIKDEERELEMKKKLLAEQEKIRNEVKKQSEDEHKLKDFEKDKKLTGALTQIETLKKKIQQGSQQIQGESLELEIEERLKSEFPSDNISEVKKGQRGADVVQEVYDKLGRKCGTILWESKNAAWKDDFIVKLKEDQRQAKAEVAALVSVNLPKEVTTFSYVNGVWVSSVTAFIALATALRFTLVSLNHEKQSNVGMDEKAKALLEYMKGSEFRLRVEAIVESFTGMQDDIEREKRWFSSKWARQEKEIRKVIDHTHGMYGDLQGVIGKSLPEIKSLQLDSGE